VIFESENLLNKSMDMKNRSRQGSYFFGHGKLLLTGEYFVLNGAKALALPTVVGQSLEVRHTPSFSPRIIWQSFDVLGNLWFEAEFEFWHFDYIRGSAGETPNQEVLFLQDLLRQARKQNPHFLREDAQITVETRLGFPLHWGLGSSSTLIYNVAQLAYISPFELLFKTSNGSGYDVACAQADSPIMYYRKGAEYSWAPLNFNPPFIEDLYLVYQGQKCDSREAVDRYKKLPTPSNETIAQISKLTEGMAQAQTLAEMDKIIVSHEALVANHLGLRPIKEEQFADYWGEIKSLGAWGGDFVLATSDRGLAKTETYFKEKGIDVVMKLKDLAILGHQSLTLMQ
jgi:mevalonate kinase